MTGFLELIKQRHGAALSVQAREFIDHAVAGAERMRGLIHSSLQRARFGRPQERMHSIDLLAVIEQVLTDLRPAILAQGATIVVGHLPTITAYASELHSIYLNLIGNALRYRADRPPRIELSARRIDHAWEFSVADNGVGIASADLERIFGMYETVSPLGDGSGIGLATCRRIIEAHGNHIWARFARRRGHHLHLVVAGRRPPGGGAARDDPRPRGARRGQRGWRSARRQPGLSARRPVVAPRLGSRLAPVAYRGRRWRMRAEARSRSTAW